jgi:dTDP-4-amino-4,6-dideoxygalactose transaminase
VSSGTAALLSGLAALGVGPGDEVVVPCYGFVAVPAVVAALGAHAVVVGVDDSLSIDPQAVAAALSPRTAAVVVAHMRGAPADMPGLAGTVRRSGVPLVEDASQALGARHAGDRLGTLGAVGTFSFQSRKVATTGEGGAVATGDPRLAQRVFTFQDCSENWRRFSPGGRAWRFAMPGINLRYSEILAAVARVQLRKLPPLLARIRRNHDAVGSVLSGAGVALRWLHDPEGATGSHLIFRVAQPTAARAMVPRLAALGLRCQAIYKPASADPHCPGGWGHYRDHMTIGPGVRTSMNALSRHVQVEVDHRWTLTQCDDIGEAILRAIQRPAARHPKESRC